MLALNEAELRIANGVIALIDRFKATKTRRDHMEIVDEPQVIEQFLWLARNREDIWLELVKPAIRESWQRTEPKR